jgi:hypothetical protein
MIECAAPNQHLDRHLIVAPYCNTQCNYNMTPTSSICILWKAESVITITALSSKGNKNRVRRSKTGNGWYSSDKLHEERRSAGNAKKRRETHDNYPMSNQVSVMPVLFCLARKTTVFVGM